MPSLHPSTPIVAAGLAGARRVEAALTLGTQAGGRQRGLLGLPRIEGHGCATMPEAGATSWGAVTAPHPAAP